jgi:hypothetical protein
VTTQNLPNCGEPSGPATVCTQWATYRTYTAMTKADFRFGTSPKAALSVAAAASASLPPGAPVVRELDALFTWGPTSETGLPAAYP